MVPFEILFLSALAAGCTAHFSPAHHQQARSQIRSQIQSSNLLDWPQASLPDGNNVPISYNGYQCYGSKYPASHEWLSWDQLWDVNREQVLSSNGGDTYIQHYIGEGILQVSSETDVDARLILAIVMQDTEGKANSRCKEGPRCGILPGVQQFDEKRPEESILTMLREGVEGRPDTVGLAKRLKSGMPPYTAIWQHHEENDLTASRENGQQYANDVANRLVGWNGLGKGFKVCTLGRIEQ